MKLILTIALGVALGISNAAFADAASGQSTYAGKGCIGCHGVGGKSVVATYPSLTGKDAAFIKQNLTDFRSGARQNAVMNAMAAGLSDDDINNLADYIGSLK